MQITVIHANLSYGKSKLKLYSSSDLIVVKCCQVINRFCLTWWLLTQKGRKSKRPQSWFRFTFRLGRQNGGTKKKIYWTYLYGIEQILKFHLLFALLSNQTTLFCILDQSNYWWTLRLDIDQVNQQWHLTAPLPQALVMKRRFEPCPGPGCFLLQSKYCTYDGELHSLDWGEGPCVLVISIKATTLRVAY